MFISVIYFGLLSLTQTRWNYGVVFSSQKSMQCTWSKNLQQRIGYNEPANLICSPKSEERCAWSGNSLHKAHHSNRIRRHHKLKRRFLKRQRGWEDFPAPWTMKTNMTTWACNFETSRKAQYTAWFSCTNANNLIEVSKGILNISKMKVESYVVIKVLL